MRYETLRISIEEKILTITIDREKQLNALNTQVIDELHQALKEAYGDEKVKGIIITGAGNKAFVAGADIKEFVGLNKEEAFRLAKKGQQLVFDFIESGSKPILAAINGFALGGGFELALACHFRVASANAQFGFPEVGLGIIPGYGGTQRLPQIVGKAKAMELVLTANRINAEEAKSLSLVSQVVLPEYLIETSKQWMSQVLSQSPEAISSAIKAINAFYKEDRDAGFNTEVEEFSTCFLTTNYTEGVDAFINKRKPQFK
ncbi:enoyl-CoA hydratase/isomerase family protein [Pseudopedobacter beijingensis]|uniref:Enoyl-CoA hydratase/isomerase family protein n=1 Tax=Pseudopedobacter beijingensis TaxID=1207056 RepID=A0ABW4IBJ6_9SPHI